jgi:hypothetical protein
MRKFGAYPIVVNYVSAEPAVTVQVPVPEQTSYGKQIPKPPDGLFGENGSWVHGCALTPEYGVYMNTKSRCVNPKNPQWQYYGARGIEFRFRSFVVFRDHLGRRAGRNNIEPDP